MKVLILLVSLISVCFSQIAPKPIIVGGVYRGGETCNSLQPPYTCSSDDLAGGIMMRQGACTYFRGLSNLPTTYNSSSDGSSVIQYTYSADDYFCQESPIQTQTISNGDCEAGCSNDKISYLYNLSSDSNDQVPKNAVLTIKSQSSNCATDWETTWESIEYLNTDTCIVDEVTGGSFKVSCTQGGMTIYSYAAPGCTNNPKVYGVGFYTDSCDGYQVCSL
ncbi:counting factor associated protein [Dictyostelium discoideum AX4]|uniref:Counting factor-associated protein C n=1 Tax=Dictyostelium discoideum TaxID=44689 RepID=CFAC_DICDI|nr:counting factor associated protein [Dictyostelium discoideum AX4]Q86HB8.1 RecName: Full=Counting factor-associated protein C; Flags: Precursor [Dictyostelium discoideum]EAL69191.1 counting factor associated protein [Dictyostelium discoideum AX4]|eukprot:XP_643170.1 counting factor associated protein [Dictyostelium discoideum AX4]